MGRLKNTSKDWWAKLKEARSGSGENSETPWPEFKTEIVLT